MSIRQLIRHGFWLAAVALLLVQVACGGGDSARRRPESAIRAAAAVNTAPTQLMYGITDSSAGLGVYDLVTVSTSSGAQAIVGKAGSATYVGHGIDFDPSTGELFAVGGADGPAGQLQRLDLSTGQATPVGIVRSSKGQAVTLTGLTFASDGALYVATLGEIGRVDRHTLAYTSAMTVPADQMLISIEIAPSGVMYAAYHHRANNSQTLLSIDPGSMTVTRQIPIVGDFYVGELDAAADGFLYHTNYGPTLVRIDPATGVQSLVGIGQVGAMSGLASLGIDDATALFDWAEKTYANFFPSHQSNQFLPPYVYRHYPETGNYLGVAGTTVVAFGPISNGSILKVGQVSDFVCQFRPTSCSVPSITAPPASVFVTAPTAAVFTIAASGTPAPSYQWQVSSNGSNFTNISGANAAAYTLASTTLADHGKQFRVLVSNQAGSVASAAATLSVGAPTASYAFSAITAKLNVPRAMHAATTLGDGRVLITGGTSSGTFPGPALNTAELFDPATNTFQTLPARMRSPRVQHTSTLLPDGKVLLAGGQSDTNDGDGIATAELFDPATQTFSSLPTAMVSPRGGHAATLLASGTVILTGGFNREAGTLVSDAELYDPIKRTFTALPAKMVLATKSHRSTLLPNGKVLITGGMAAKSARIAPEQFDPATQTFSAITSRPAVARSAHEATRLPSGAVLISGGATAMSPAQVSALKSAEAFDPSTGVFSPLAATMVSTRAAHAAALLNDGSVLLVGGIASSANGALAILDSAEIFRLVASAAKPVVTLTAEPTTLTLGASVTLHWSSSLADSCAAFGSWSGARALSGSQTITPTALGSTSYSLFCTGAGGTSSAMATVEVQAASSVPTVNLTTSASSAPAGSTVTLQWTSANATSCSASNDWAGTKATQGSEPVSTGTTAGTRTFKITCTGPGGTASATVTVAVTAIACAQIGGTWTETVRVTGTCDPPDSYDSGNVTGNGIIVQNGCDISYTVAGIPRTGKVNGFNLTLTGPAALVSSELTVTANTLTITGTISADARRITATGVGQLGGHFADGFSQMCTLKSTSTMTR